MAPAEFGGLLRAPGRVVLSIFADESYHHPLMAGSRMSMGKG